MSSSLAPLTTAAVAFTASQCILPNISPVAAYVPQGPFFEVKDCVTSNCPDLSENSLFPRIAKAYETFSNYNATVWQYYWSGVKKDPEYLRFREKDSRDKSLFISAGYEQNGALDPKFISSVMNAFGKDFDVKFVIANSVEDVCRYIREAKDIAIKSKSKLNNVIIDAYGNEKNIVISLPGTDSGTLNEKTDFKTCFEGVDPSGRIILVSAKAGDHSNGEPIAQKIATIAQREVIAPTEMVYANKIDVTRHSQFHIYHPSEKWFNGNIFKVFRPIYQKCQQVYENALHFREIRAIEAIKGNLVPKGLISKDATFNETQEFVRFCDDDPKKKLLFISAEADHNGALNPYYKEEILGTLADHYDIKFKVISKYDEVCQEITEASKTGNLEYVILNIHGNRRGMVLADPDTEPDNWIHMYRNHLSKCFSWFNPKGKIILISCSTGAPSTLGSEDNIAGLISKLAKKSVIAPTKSTFTGLLEMTSKDPIAMYEDSRWFFEKLYKYPENIYKEFKPNN